LGNYAFIFVTHEIDEAVLLGDRILVLSERPEERIDKFVIRKEKSKRDLTDTEMVTIRNEIIRLLESSGGCSQQPLSISTP